LLISLYIMSFMALFGLPHIRFVWLLFSAGTVFLSHNNSAGTVFLSYILVPYYCMLYLAYIPLYLAYTSWVDLSYLAIYLGQGRIQGLGWRAAAWSSPCNTEYTHVFRPCPSHERRPNSPPQATTEQANTAGSSASSLFALRPVAPSAFQSPIVFLQKARGRVSAVRRRPTNQRWSNSIRL